MTTELVVLEKPTICILIQMVSGCHGELAKPVGEFLQYRVHITPTTFKNAVTNSPEIEKQHAGQSPQQFHEVVANLRAVESWQILPHQNQTIHRKTKDFTSFSGTTN